MKVYEHGNCLLAQGVKKIIDEGLTQDGLEPQGEGQYFGVIEKEKMEEVVRKLACGEYAFQR